MDLLRAPAPPASAAEKGRARLFPLSIRTHLLLILIVLTVGPMVIFGFVQTRLIRTREINNAASRYQVRASSLAREIDFFISDATDNLQLLAGAIAQMKRLRPKNLEAHVTRALDTRTIDHVAVMIPSGRSIVNLARSGRLPTGVDYSDRPYFRSVVASRAPQLSAPLLGRVSRRPEVFLAVPALDRRGALKAILVGGLDIAELHNRHLSQFGKIAAPSRTLLLDLSGRPVAASDRTLEETFAGTSNVRIAPKSWEEDPRLLAWTDERGHRIVGASASLSTWKWTVLSGIPEEKLRVALAAPIRQVGYVALWLLLACVIVSPLVARIMGAPIIDMQQQAKRIAGGALGEKVTFIPYLPRELHELSNTLNTMSAQLARNYREASAVGLVAQTASQSLDLHEILRRSLAAIADVIPLDGALIYLREGDELRVAAHLGLSEELVREVDRMRVGEGFSGQVAQSGVPLLVEDVLTDPRLTRMAVKKEGLHSLASVPISSRGRTLGVLNSTRRGIRQFDQDELTLLATIGAQIGLAIENAGLYAQAQDRLQETEALLAVTQALSSTLDLRESLRRGARELARTLHADCAGAYLISADGQNLQPFSGYRLPKERLSSFRTTTMPLHYNRFVEEGFAARRAIFSPDCRLDPRFNEQIKLFQPRAVVMVPFFARDEILGSLFAAWWVQPHTPTPRELELADGIGRQLALTIENARLYQDSLQRAAALAESEDRYRRLAEGAKDIIFTKDAQGRFTYLNPRVEEVLGYQPEEMLGRPAIAYVVPKDHKLVRESFAKAMRGESAHDVFEIEVIKKDGSTIPMEMAASTIYDAEGRAIGRQEIARDLTERRRLEAEVKERKRLEEINRFKSQFLANMSHELRTPMNAVLGFSQILQDRRFGPLTEKQARFVDNILVSGRHLLTLIDDVLDLARIESGKMRLHPAEFEVRAAIEEASGIIQHQADAKRQSLRIDVDPDVASCFGDRQRVQQVLLNLLSNAIKFTPEDGQITVTARRGSRGKGLGSSEGSPPDPKPSTLYPGDFVEIAVSDTGIGISPNDLPRLFQEFEQLEPFYTKHYQGSGLGLALCKHLVELHGGRIWASSEGEGRGSVFTFTIPVVAPTDASSNA